MLILTKKAISKAPNTSVIKRNRLINKSTRKNSLEPGEGKGEKECRVTEWIDLLCARADLRVEQGWKFGSDKALAVYTNDLCWNEAFGSLRKRWMNYTRGGVCFCMCIGKNRGLLWVIACALESSNFYVRVVWKFTITLRIGLQKPWHPVARSDLQASQINKWRWMLIAVWMHDVRSKWNTAMQTK